MTPFQTGASHRKRELPDKRDDALFVGAARNIDAMAAPVSLGCKREDKGVLRDIDGRSHDDLPERRKTTRHVNDHVTEYETQHWLLISVGNWGQPQPMHVCRFDD